VNYTPLQLGNKPEVAQDGILCGLSEDAI